MQLAIKILIGLLIFYLSVMFFLPKKELYFLAEKQLEEQKLIISDEKIDEGIFDIKLSEGKLFFEDMDVATFENINIATTLFTNSAEITNFIPAQSLQDIIPVGIKTLLLTQSIINFDMVDIELSGNFGEAEGVVDLEKREIKLFFKTDKSKSFTKLKKYLKKTKEGWIYEKKF